MEAGNALLDDYVLGLTGVERPKVCFLPSASGDADHYIVRFYRAFLAGALRADAHVSLFRRDRGAGLGEDLAAHLLDQDLIIEPELLVAASSDTGCGSEAVRGDLGWRRGSSAVVANTGFIAPPKRATTARFRVSRPRLLRSRRVIGFVVAIPRAA